MKRGKNLSDVDFFAVTTQVTFGHLIAEDISLNISQRVK